MPKIPSFIEPSHPKASDKVPDSADWIYEIKHDGYRGQLHIDHGEVRIFTRRGNDWTTRFPSVVQAAQSLPVEHAVFDGEIAYIDEKTGLTDFQLFQRALSTKKAGNKNIIYYAFDLLYLNGRDLRSLPLIKRKQILKDLLPGADTAIKYVDHFETNGPAAFERLAAMNSEGLVAKKRQSPYSSGETDAWRKIKTRTEDTFPVIGFVERQNNPALVGALYIGRMRDNKLQYAGKVPSGYSVSAAALLRRVLDPYIRDTSPLAENLKKPHVTWVEPAVGIEAMFNSVTAHGYLRAASYKGLREDLGDMRDILGLAKPALRRFRQEAIPGALAPSKEKLSAYWHKVAGQALPYIANRPLVLVREEAGKIFYHRGPLPPLPQSVHQVPVTTSDGTPSTRAWIDSLEGLLGLVEIGTVEIHPYSADVKDLGHAKEVIFDLDPADNVPWEYTIQTALQIRDIYKKLGLKPWAKLTGGKGIHIVIPLTDKLTHEQAKDLAMIAAAHLVTEQPDRYTTSNLKANRPGRIFLDIRNGRGLTAVGAFSPRARAGFPVAAPVSWDRIEKGVRADAYRIDNSPPRIKAP